MFETNLLIKIKIKDIALNAFSLITQEKSRFLFDLERVFSMTRRKFSNKRSKNRSFKNKKLFEKSNNLFRFEIKECVVLFKLINKIIQKDEAFVNISLFILIVVKIMQKLD